jgi:aminopeptidase N
MCVFVPAGIISIANVNLIDSVGLPGGASEQHWRIATPQANYLTTLIIGDFATVKETVGGVDLLYHVPKEWANETEYFFGKTPSILRFFSDYILPYPYSRYAQTTVWDFLFGGDNHEPAFTLYEERDAELYRL